MAESGHARALSPNAASGRAGSFGGRRVVGGEVRDEEETMSAGTRNSSNALDGGPRRDRYSVVLRNPPFSDFQWYQRPIGRPVPRAIPGAWRRHRQSTLLNSTAAGPTNGHTSAHLPLPHRPPIDRPGQPSSVAPSTSNVGQSLSESRTSRPRLVPRRGGVHAGYGGDRLDPQARLTDRRSATGHCRPASTRTPRGPDGDPVARDAANWPR